MICFVLVCIAALIIAVVEINQWAHDVGIAQHHEPQIWAKTIGFILGILCGVLATAMIVGWIL